MEEEKAIENEESFCSEYRLDSKLGVGAYSSVWNATHIATNKSVAIKKEGEVFNNLVDAKRLLREIKILRQLQHKNIIKLLDVFILPKTTVENFNEIYLVLEIAEASLHKLIKSPIFLHPTQIRTIMYNTLIGLNYIHSCGVIHRDLKPANILIDSSCNTRICDFGLARSLTGIKPGCLHYVNSLSSLNGKEDEKKHPKAEEVESKEEEKKRPKPKKARLSFSAAIDQRLPEGKAKEELTDKKDVLTSINTNSLTLTTPSRRLTSHVVTRWYRAPEIILMQDEYGPPIDIWALGCIFAELLSMIKGHNLAAEDRNALFPGTSCLLLSPHESSPEKESGISTDQLSIVLQVLGPPGTEDVAFLKDPGIIEFVNTVAAHSKKINLADKFPLAEVHAIDLLHKMLAFNPNNRITAEECLTHPYFGKMPPFIPGSYPPTQVQLEFENEGVLTIEKLRGLFGEELKYFKQLKELSK